MDYDEAVGFKALTSRLNPAGYVKYGLRYREDVNNIRVKKCKPVNSLFVNRRLVESSLLKISVDKNDRSIHSKITVCTENKLCYILFTNTIGLTAQLICYLLLLLQRQKLYFYVFMKIILLYCFPSHKTSQWVTITKFSNKF